MKYCAVETHISTLMILIVMIGILIEIGIWIGAVWLLGVIFAGMCFDNIDLSGN